nr:RNA methyltransferase [Allomuricauda sp.]
MVTKNQIKLVTSLQQKKYRTLHGLFAVEGIKSVNELLESGLTVQNVYVNNRKYIDSVDSECVMVTDTVMRQMSSLSTPSGVIGVFEIPKPKRFVGDGWTLALDAVRDPGNLGTIIRLCDWFDIEHLVCSQDTVDCYNPKVLQATMGSIARVNIHYVDLPQFLNENQLPVYGTFMNGANIYEEKLGDKGILVLGNEANGISLEVEKYVTRRIGIPQFGKQTTESLNVATASAIFLSEIRRG